MSDHDVPPSDATNHPTDDPTDDPFARIDGEIVNGTFATCAAHVDASAWRLTRCEPNLRLCRDVAVGGGLAAAAFLAAAAACLAAASGFWLAAAGVVCLVLAVAAAAVAAIPARILVKAVPMMRVIYRNALLTPGVVVSARPLELVAMANMDTGLGEPRYAVKRVAGGRLPKSLRAVGSRVACVSGFQDGPTEEAWGNFDPRPLAWGTGDARVLADRAEKLGEEAFADLEAAVRAGRVPAKVDELVWLGADAGGRPDVAAGPKPPPMPIRPAVTPPPLPLRPPPPGLS